MYLNLRMLCQIIAKGGESVGSSLVASNKENDPLCNYHVIGDILQSIRIFTLKSLQLQQSVNKIVLSDVFLPSVKERILISTYSG